MKLAKGIVTSSLMVSMALIALAATSYLKTGNNISKARAQYDWLDRVADERSLIDHFRFPFSKSREIARNLAPFAVEALDIIPFDLDKNAQLSDANNYIAISNELIDACKITSVSLPKCADSHLDHRVVSLDLALDETNAGKRWWVDRDGLYVELKEKIEVTIESCDFTPLSLSNALITRPSHERDKQTATGWIELSAGECSRIPLGTFRDVPRVLAHTKAIKDETLKSLQRSHSYNRAWNHSNPAWGGEEMGCAIEVKESKNGALDCAVINRKGFEQVTIKREGLTASGKWDIVDHGLCSDTCAAGAPVEKQQEWARNLRMALKKREAYRRSYGAISRPYWIGINMDDPNGEFRLGVTVSEAFSKTPFGFRIPFKVGDIVTELDGVPIFSELDLFAALAQFVDRESARVPVKAKVWRREGNNSRKYELSAVAYFNERYWRTQGFSDDWWTWLKAAGSSFILGASFDKYPQARCKVYSTDKGSDWNQCLAKIRNEWLIYKQMYPTSWFLGELPLFFVSPTRSLIRIAGVSRYAKSGVGMIAVELLESGVNASIRRLPYQPIEHSVDTFITSSAMGIGLGFAKPLIR